MKGETATNTGIKEQNRTEDATERHDCSSNGRADELRRDQRMSGYSKEAEALSTTCCLKRERQ